MSLPIGTGRPDGFRRGRACPVPAARACTRPSGAFRECRRILLAVRRWRTALIAALAPMLLAGCAVKPAALAEEPGDYEAFLREIMAEAARTETPKPAARPAQTAGDWLGTGGESGGDSPLGGL